MQCSSTRTVCRNFHACNSRSSKEMIQIFSHQEKSNKAKHILPLKKSQTKHSPIGISQQLIQQLLSPGHQINWFFPHLGSYLDNGKETSQVSLQVGPNARTEILIQVVKINIDFSTGPIVLSLVCGTTKYINYSNLQASTDKCSTIQIPILHRFFYF